MTPKEAQKAIDINPEEYMFSVGNWSHTLSWFEGNRPSSVLHFWPNENIYRYKAVFPNGKWINTKRMTSTCGISDEWKTIPYMSDVYLLRKLSKCKKCLRNLTAVTNQERHIDSGS